jgi:hypothetical protein
MDQKRVDTIKKLGELKKSANSRQETAEAPADQTHDEMWQ